MNETPLTHRSPSRLDPAFRAAWLALRPWNRHSLILSILGVLYLGAGVIWLVNEVTTTRAAQMALPLTWTGGAWWPLSMAWILVGSATLLSTRWPPFYSRWGYVATGGLASFWGLCAATSAVAYGNWSAGLSGVFIYAIITILIWGIAGMVAPIPAPPHLPGPPPPLPEE